MRLMVGFFVLSVALPALAESASTDDAVRAAQQAITDPALRAQTATSDPKAAQAIRAVEQLGGNAQNTQAIYALAADILGTLAKDANGDPTKMMEILDLASKDPESFGNRFTPEQKAKLRDIAKLIEASKLH